MDLSLYLIQFVCKCLFPDIRHNKQKLIPSHTDQHICPSDVILNNTNYRCKCKVTCIMAECVIVDLEVIKIDHCHTGRHIRISDTLFVITSVINSCQCIGIQFTIVTGKLFDKFIPSILIHDRICIHLIDEFHDIRFPVNLYILRNNLIYIGIQIFKFQLLIFFTKSVSGSTVLTVVSLLPKRIAFTRESFCICDILYISCFKGFFIEQTYHVKYFTQFLYHHF